MFGVVFLTGQKNNNDSWESELVSFVATVHVFEEPFFELFSALLRVRIDPVGVLNFDSKLLRSHLHSTENRVGNLFIVVFINKDPLFFQESNWFLDRESSQDVLIAVDDLVLFEDSGRSQDICLHPDGSLFQLKTPLFNTLLTKKFLAHVLNLFNFLLRSYTCLHQSIAHASSFANVIGDSIHETELRRKVEVSFLIADEEEGLLVVRDSQAIVGLEVVSDRNLLRSELKLLFVWVSTKINISDDIRALVTPVSNDRLGSKLEFDKLFPVMLVLGTFLHLFDLFKARFS